MGRDTSKNDAIADVKLELAQSYNMEVWHLFEKSDRGPAVLERMIHAAHASFRLWQDVGTEINAQRGYYLLSRVYAEAGDGERAMAYAKKCREISDSHPDVLRDFDRAYVLEVEARAHAVSGNIEEASTYYMRALAEGQNIKRDKDREIFEQDILSGNWGDFPGT